LRRQVWYIPAGITPGGEACDHSTTGTARRRLRSFIGGKMKKPNVLIVGDTKIEVEDDVLEERQNLIIIECYDPEQIREALRTGKIEFTIFGGEP
jgi:hypothetical protein